MDEVNIIEHLLGQTTLITINLRILKVKNIEPRITALFLGTGLLATAKESTAENGGAGRAVVNTTKSFKGTIVGVKDIIPSCCQTTISPTPNRHLHWMWCWCGWEVRRWCNCNVKILSILVTATPNTSLIRVTYLFSWESTRHDAGEKQWCGS